MTPAIAVLLVLALVLVALACRAHRLTPRPPLDRLDDRQTRNLIARHQGRTSP